LAGRLLAESLGTECQGLVQPDFKDRFGSILAEVIDSNSGLEIPNKQPSKIVCQAHQIPFQFNFRVPAHVELPKAHGLFDDAENWLDCLLAQFVQLFAFFRVHPVLCFFQNGSVFQSSVRQP
jgi:hypothetical protein